MPHDRGNQADVHFGEQASSYGGFENPAKSRRVLRQHFGQYQRAISMRQATQKLGDLRHRLLLEDGRRCTGLRLQKSQRQIDPLLIHPSILALHDFIQNFIVLLGARLETAGLLLE